MGASTPTASFDKRFDADMWLEEIIATPVEELPSMWSWEHVSARLTEAADVTRRERVGRVGPKGAGSGWISYVHTKEEVDEAVRFALTEPAPPKTEPPTMKELSRRDETLGWIAKYTEDDADMRSCVSDGAAWEASGQDVGALARQFYGSKKEFHTRRQEGLRQIASGLHTAGVPVT